MAAQPKIADVHEPAKVFLASIALPSSPLREIAGTESAPPINEPPTGREALPPAPSQPADQSMQDWLASDEAAFMMGM
jgi:hypothetical protein